MSAMANATPIVTTVTKTANKEKAPDAAPRVNILDFCEEHYEDILPIIMEKAWRDKRKEVQTRLNFRENSKKTRRERENSLNSRAENSPTRFHPERSRTRDREKHDDRNVREHPRIEDHLLGVEKSYGDTYSQETRTKYRDRSRDGDQFRSVKRWRESESSSSRGSESSTRATRVWFDELPLESIDGYKGPKVAFLAYFMQQKKYVKDLVKIHNIKQRDGETIEDFMERFKVETEHMNEPQNACWIFGVHAWGPISPELTKRLNSFELRPKDHVRNETVTYSLHTRRSRRSAVQEERSIHPLQLPRQIKRTLLSENLTSEVSQGKDGGLASYTPPAPDKAQKKSSRPKQEKLQTHPPAHGHSTDECMQLKKQIEELVRAGKLSHLIKEIKQGRDQTKNGKKEAPTKDKSLAIYMIQPWQRMTRQKLNPKADARKPTTKLLPNTDNSDGNRRIACHRSGNWWTHDPPSLYKTGEEKGQAPERAKAIEADVHKLVEAGIMREVYYHDWLSNLVMVKRHDGSWRMCVDFTDLNKACYHQIQMAESDEEKTAFHTSQGVYCYTKMPFVIKNAGATYQRLVDKAFDSQVGRNMEVYVDDLVIKSHTEAEMIRDINETFRTPEGIKPCHDKTKDVLQLPSLRTIKEVQSLNGKLASLNRFLSKSAEKFLPLFKTLKKCIKKCDFHWTPEAKQACKQLKQDLSELPLLVAPKPKEELIVYLAASYGAISAVLMTKRETVQTPVYFVSRALQGPELNYSPMEKLVLSLVFAAKRLRRTSVKGQILADFLVEKPDENLPETPAADIPQEPWTLFTDGSSCIDGSGVELILTSPKGTEFTYALRFQFTASNKEAEYEALIAGLRIAAQMGVRNVHVSVDSKLVANQVLGAYVAKEQNMIKYLEKVKSLVLVEILKDKSIHEEEVATVVEEEGITYMTPIIEYLKDGTLPGDRKEASKLRIKARHYELLEGVLYKRSFLKPWLWCVKPLQADYVIREIHEGSCSKHAGPRSVVAKAMRLGYYWPTMHRDAREMIRTCNDCQIHHLVPRNPQQPLTLITAPWPFYKWGIDIAGPFLKEPGKVKFLIAAMDYFTKWIEAKAVATITGNQAHRTMIKSSHDDTPFSLTYGIEVVIPAEIGMPTYRTAAVDTVHNNEELRLNLDLLEEKRESVAICEAKAKMKMAKYYNARVRGVAFRPGDFVYRSNDASHAAAGGKLGPKWEGLYEVTEALGDGAYKLRTMEGADLPRTWNIANLKKCYL
ncbi:reverse transcriptase domain-containing protein [Tanacetum coccineum]